MDAGEGTEDVIVVRGISSDVDRVVKEINKIVEDAKNDQILSSYVSLLTLLPYALLKEYLVHRFRD